MATKYPKSAQTGDAGVAIVRKIVTEAGAVYHAFENPDLGIDAAIELLTDDRETSGDLVLAQIKSGRSYIRGGRFYVDADQSHFETWARYAVPVVGIVCDPEAEVARWVDISAYLSKHPEKIANGPYSILAPANQPLSAESFGALVARFRRPHIPVTCVDTTPNLLIRNWKPNDAGLTKVLLQPIAVDYPGFDAWLEKKFADEKVSKKVVELDNAIAAFSMWQAKDERNVKLQTFMVGPLFRGTAIGQHLLYHELRTWARDPNVQRVYVTVASSKVDLINYFKEFGFSVEGFAPNRYERTSNAAEIIMAKHFVRDVVRTLAELESVTRYIVKRIWGIRADSADRFGVTGPDVGIKAVLPAVNASVNPSLRTVDPRLSITDSNGVLYAKYDDASLTEEFYPLRIHLVKKRYVIVPIFKHWVEAMLSTSGPGTPLKLRVDNAYYCYPKVKDLARGDLVVFYEPKKGGGRGAAIGAAIVLEVEIATPKTLHNRFAALGVYELKEVVAHKNANGDAMTIRFGLFEPFDKMMKLDQIRAVLGNQTNVQGLTPIKRDVFERIRSEGLGEPHE